MNNFNRRSSHGHHDSKQSKLAQEANSRGSHAFTLEGSWVEVGPGDKSLQRTGNSSILWCWPCARLHMNKAKKARYYNISSANTFSPCLQCSSKTSRASLALWDILHFSTVFSMVDRLRNTAIIDCNRSKNNSNVSVIKQNMIGRWRGWL